MFEKTKSIWLDGKMIPWEQANIHVLTHTLHYGVGVFEGIRYYDCDSKGTAIFRLQEHMHRFEESCRVLALKFKFSFDDLVRACVEVVKENGLKEGYIRPLAFISDTPGVGLWAYDNPVRIAIMTYGWGAYLGNEGIKNGIRTRVSSYTRHHPNISMTRAKVCGQYVNSVLAKREARMSGADEAIMLDPEGYVAEGTGENIFVIHNGTVRTPSPGSILCGITRDTIMTLLKEDGIPMIEDRITRDDLYIAKEIFLTGTAAEITPVREVEYRPVGDGKPGALTQKLQQSYANLVRGKDSKHISWLTFIEK